MNSNTIQTLKHTISGSVYEHSLWKMHSKIAAQPAGGVELFKSSNLDSAIFLKFDRSE